MIQNMNIGTRPTTSSNFNPLPIFTLHHLPLSNNNYKFHLNSSVFLPTRNTNWSCSIGKGCFFNANIDKIEGLLYFLFITFTSRPFPSLPNQPLLHQNKCDVSLHKWENGLCMELFPVIGLNNCCLIVVLRTTTHCPSVSHSAPLLCSTLCL